MFMSLKPRWFMILLCLISLPTLYFLTSLPLATVQQSEDSSPLKFEVNNAFFGRLTQIIKVENPTSQGITGGKLFVPLVRNETARHYVLFCNISSKIGQPTILEDDSANTYAFWKDIVVGGRQEFSVEVNYYVLSFGIRYLVNVAEYEKSSYLYRKYTQPEELIQSDNPEITFEMQKLTKDVSNIHDKVSRVFNFVVSHLHYVSQEYERGALWALENGTGDCSEYSYLFVALCRAAGIPARIQTGFAFHLSNEKLKDGHMWAEYYLENYGWIPVDATWRLFDAMDEKHFGSLQGISELIPYSNYFFNCTKGPEESSVKDSQRILLEPYPTSFLDNDFVDEAVKAVQKINQARSAIFIGKLVGVPLIFPSESKEISKTFLESQVQLQNALENWKEHPATAQIDIVGAARNGENALQKAWMLVSYSFAIFIAVLTVILLLALLFVKRYQTRAGKQSSNGIMKKEE